MKMKRMQKKSKDPIAEAIDEQLTSVQQLLGRGISLSPDVELTSEQRGVVADAVRNLAPSVMQAVIEAIEKVVRASDEGTKFTIDEKAKYSMHGIIRKHFQDSLRRNPGSDGVFLPFQDTLPDSLRQDIDCGKVNLIDFCNGSTGLKILGSEYLDSGTLETSRIPHTTFLPFDMRRLNSRINSTQICNISADSARFVNMENFWRALSPFDYQQKPGNKLKFSLPTAVMTLRLCGNRNPPDVKSYLHYDHPTNTMRHGASTSNFQKCGGAFAAATKVMDAWNAMVWRHHGQPGEGTPQYELAAKSFITPADCEACLAGISRIAHRDIEETQAHADLFFCTPSVPDLTLCSDMRGSPDQSKQSLPKTFWKRPALQKDAAGEFAKHQPITDSELKNAGCEAEGCDSGKAAATVTFTLASPAQYKWERPRDVIQFVPNNNSGRRFQQNGKGWNTSKHQKLNRKGSPKGGKGKR